MTSREQHPSGAARLRAKDTLALRIASAAVLAPTALGASWIGGPLFAGLVAFLCVLMAFEWARMVEGAAGSRVFQALATGAALAIGFAAAGAYPVAFGAAALGGLAAALFSRRSGGARWAAFGALYFIAPAVALIWLRESVENGRGLVLLLFAIVWSADTGGYLGGRLVGGPKLSPAVSPAKTWAGAVGGLILGAIAGQLGAAIIFGDAANLSYAAIGASLGLSSILGDMAESAFKRVHGIKDMSGFIPGHGGVLDRLDGMIFATAAMTAVLYGHILAAGAGQAG
jgi:phosphatidate cytidylyltransferase